MTGPPNDDAKRLKIFLLQSVEFGDEDVDRMRDDDGAIAERERFEARGPMGAGAKLQPAAHLDVKIRLFPRQASSLNEHRQIIRITKQIDTGAEQCWIDGDLDWSRAEAGNVKRTILGQGSDKLLQRFACGGRKIDIICPEVGDRFCAPCES